MHRQVLCLIADCSGSMAEPGKSSALAVVLDYVRQCTRLNALPGWCAEVCVIAWSDSAQVLPVLADADLTLPAPGGKGSMLALTALIEQLGADNPAGTRLLFMSDGGIDLAGQKTWTEWRARGMCEIRALTVGADASRLTLEALAGKGAVYQVEEIGAALHDWALDQGEPHDLAETMVAPAAAVADDWQ